MERQLGGAGGFAGTLQSDQHDHGGRSAGELQLALAAAEQLHQLVVDDLDHVLRRRKAFHDLLADSLLADARLDVLDHLEVDVRFQQSQAHFAQGGIDVRLGEFAFAPELTENAFQAVLQCLEHPRVSVAVARGADPSLDAQQDKGTRLL